MVIADEHSFSWQKLGGPVRSALFFILFFVLLCLWVDPKLIYHGHGQFMMFKIHVPGMMIFADVPAYPGEAVEYAAARLSHYYYYSWAGALIITAISWLLCIGTGRFIRAVGDGELQPLRFIPPIILLMQYGRYYHYLADVLTLLVALLFLYLYIRMPLRGTGLRFIVFLIFSAIIYTLADKGFPVFIALCVIFELFNTVVGCPVDRRRLALCIFYLLSALLIPWLIGALVFELHLTDAYSRLLPFHPEAESCGVILTFGLFLFFPIVGLGCLLWRGRMRKHPSGRTLSSWAAKFPEYYHKIKFKWSLATLVLLVATAGAVLLTCDRFARKQLRIDYFASQKMWPQLLREAHQLPLLDYNFFVCHDVNRALYHTGRLAYEMFSYPQHLSGLLLTTEKRFEGVKRVRTNIKCADTLYELGYINQAEHVTYEALALVDYYPIGLQRLAMVNIIKGQPDAARIFLRALSRDFIYKDWANKYLARLETDPLLSTDKQIQRMRSVMPVKDNISSITSPEKLFLNDLFLRNIYNRMAFEYLMAFCLLTGQTEAVVNGIRFLDNFDYPKSRIPLHYEEAILLYTSRIGKKPNLFGRQINIDTVYRFEEFLQRSQLYENNPQAAARALAKDFGNTYYYYHLLGRSGSAK